MRVGLKFPAISPARIANHDIRAEPLIAQLKANPRHSLSIQNRRLTSRQIRVNFRRHRPVRRVFKLAHPGQRRLSFLRDKHDLVTPPDHRRGEMLELPRTVLMCEQDLQGTGLHSLTPHFHTLFITFQLL